MNSHIVVDECGASKQRYAFEKLTEVLSKEGIESIERSMKEFRERFRLREVEDVGVYLARRDRATQGMAMICSERCRDLD